MTPTPELNTERTHQDYFHSPLGYIAKNNLNDLMADIQYAKLEYKGKSSIEKIREYH